MGVQSDTSGTGMSRRRFLGNMGAAGAGILASSVLLQACRGETPDTEPGRETGAPTGPQADHLEFGWIQPLTGRLAEAYAPVYLTALMAIDEINEGGGVLGRPLERVRADDEGTPAQQATVAQRLAQEAVPVALGPTGSSQALASVRAMEPHRIVQSAWGGPPVLGDGTQFPYHYQLVMNTGIQGAAATKFLWEGQGARTIGVLAEDTDFGSSITETVQQTLRDEYGADTATVQVFPVDETDMSSYVRSLERAGVDAVTLWSGQPGATALSLRAMASMDFMPTIIAHDLNYPPGLYDDVPAELLERFYGTIYRNLTYEAGGEPSGPVRDWAERILAHPDMVEGATFAAAGSPYYDWIYMLKQVIEEVGDFDSERIKEALDNLDGYQGMLGTFSFTPDDHSGIGADEVAIATIASATDDVSLGIFRERVEGY